MKKRLLIVEDEMILAMELEQSLIPTYEVVKSFTKGEQAVKFADSSIDVILMDIQLAGEIDGIEAAKLIQDKYKTPIILMTAYDNNSIYRQRSLELKPMEYLTKPLVKADLISAIEKVSSEIEPHRVSRRHNYVRG